MHCLSGYNTVYCQCVQSPVSPTQLPVFTPTAVPSAPGMACCTHFTADLQVSLLEQLADMHSPDVDAGFDAGNSTAAGAAGQQSTVAAEGGARCVALSAVLPVLGAPQVEQLMQRLHQVTQVDSGECDLAAWPMGWLPHALSLNSAVGPPIMGVFACVPVVGFRCSVGQVTGLVKAQHCNVVCIHSHE